MRVRVAAIIKMDGGYALMHRKDVKKRNLSEYYTFPGGGLEEGEDLEIGVKREIEEEFGIQVNVIKKLYEEESIEFDQKSYYFLCEYKSGEFGTGTGPEFSNDPKYIDSGKLDNEEQNIMTEYEQKFMVFGPIYKMIAKFN